MSAELNQGPAATLPQPDASNDSSARRPRRSTPHAATALRGRNRASAGAGRTGWGAAAGGDLPASDGGPTAAIVVGPDDPARAVIVSLLTQRKYTVLVMDCGEPGDVDVLPLLRVAVDVRARLVVPTGIAEHYAVTTGRALFDEAGIATLGGNIGATSLAGDRLYTHAHLRARGVPVPHLILDVPDAPDDPRWSHLLAAAGGALVAVPRDAAEAVDSRVLTTPQETRDAIHAKQLLLEPDQGDCYCVPLFRARDGKGGQHAAVVTVPRRLDTAGGPTDGRSQRISFPDAERTAIAAARAMGMTGPCTVWLQNRLQDGLVVVDIAPGFTADVALAPGVFDKALASSLTRTG